MSVYHEIFLRPLAGESDAGVVARDLSDVLGVEFVSTITDYGATYAGQMSETVVEIFPSHDLVDDGGLPFESHPIEVDFRNLAKDEAHEKAVMQEAFDGLAQLARYSLFSSFNAQLLIESRIVDMNSLRGAGDSRESYGQDFGSGR